MTLTVLMTNVQANHYRHPEQFPTAYLDGRIYAHYLEHRKDSWHWSGWDNINTISRKHLIKLSYADFISLAPITLTKLKDHFPEFFI